ncbi:MAG: hypothetical protein SFV15_12865 [Polyangiaceae bacterium]|nr:hypothetical protein [Polyangiaceae bacterium]
MSPNPTAPRPLFAAIGYLAAAAPLVVGIWRASFGSQWRDDAALLAAVGEGPPAVQGALSALLGSLAVELPIGGKWLRAALVSVLALSLAGALIYQLTRHLARLLGVAPGAASAAALGAAWLVTLAPAWQLEATVGGGLTLAAVLCLAGLWVCREPEAPWVPLALAALLGAALAESWVAALALAVAIGVRVSTRRGVLPWSKRLIAVALGIFFLTALGLIFGQLLRSGGTFTDLGIAFAGETAPRVTNEQPLAMVDENFTLLALGLALLGIGATFLRSNTRALALSLATLCVAGAFFGHTNEEAFGANPWAPLALLGLAGIGIFAGVGAASAFTLSRLRVPMARQSVGLLVTALYVLVLLGFERSTHVAARRDHVASEAWTDEALSDLPPGGVLLLDSAKLAWHLWAAREIGGQRPDLIVAPLAALKHGSGANALIGQVPALAPVVRDLRLSRRPSEFALSSLAVERPLFVEFDPNWDPRMREHLVPHGFWVAFSPHALGRSDREGAALESDAAFSRVVALAQRSGARDAGTLRVLEDQLAEHALMLFSLQDFQAASMFAEKLRLIAPGHPSLESLVAPKVLAARGGVD